jgi:hypothetical protein
MKTFLKTAAALLLFFHFTVSAVAQDSTNQVPASLISKFAQRQSFFSQTEIFLHIDKSIYGKNENIWFKSYLLKSSAIVPLQHTLFVFVSEKNSGKIILSDKFFMQNGVSAGSLFIPDSAKAGDYNLIAYTNTFSSEVHPIIFQQKIRIRDTIDPYTFTFEDAAAPASADSLSFTCKIRDRQKLYPKNAEVCYTILSDDSIISKGKKKINDYGEVSVTIAAASATGKLNFEALITNGKDSFLFDGLPLTVLDNRIKIRFFPESGGLADSINTRVAFEATTLSGKPAAVTGELYEESTAIAKLQSNNEGIGSFYIKARAGKKYTICLNDGKLFLQTIDFPEIKKNGYNLFVKNGVVSDTLTVDIQTRSMEDKVHLLVHDYHNLFGFYDLTIKNKFLSFNIPLGQMQPGLLTLTLLNTAEEPVAERTVLVGMNQIPAMVIQLDSASYHKRSKVNLKIFAKDNAGNAIQGAYSLACIYRKRIDTTAYQNIVPYSIFNSYVQHGIIDKPGMYMTGTKDDLETLLLTRCLPKYKEPATNQAIEKYAAGAVLDATGYVLRYNRNVKSPVQLTIIGSGGIKEIYTDNRGFFMIPPEMIAANADEKINLTAGSGKDKGYTIILNNFLDTLQKKIAALRFAEALQSKAAVLPEEEKIFPKAKMLETAVVRAKSEKDVSFTSASIPNAVFKSLTCNDWVCMYNILNCKNHPSGTSPVDGQYYYYKGDVMLYKACRSESLSRAGQSRL